jgi:GTP-binding protein
LRVDAGQTTLRDFQVKRHFRATPGGRGERANRHGKAGEDLVLHVPPGTAVVDDADGRLLADLVAVGQEAVVAHGGRGGLGNVHFKTSTHQAPRHAQKGEPGEEREVSLELRLIADIGLVGLPNAGKSTLLAALTAATPKIADYPFTTLEPNLGVLDLLADEREARGDREDGRAGEGGPGHEDRRVTVADVPGLIEGASSGAGLGHAFLRHVERTRVLVHVVDGSSPNPERDYAIVRGELAAHDPALLEKATLVAFNKLDRPGASEAWPAFQRARRKEGRPVVPIAAALGDGLDALRRALGELLPSAAELAAAPEPAGIVVHRVALEEAVTVHREVDGGWRVGGRRVERLAARTDFTIDESAERFQRALERLGVDAQLRRAGVEPGDTVRFGKVELEWAPEPWSVAG